MKELTQVISSSGNPYNFFETKLIRDNNGKMSKKQINKMFGRVCGYVIDLKASVSNRKPKHISLSIRLKRYKGDTNGLIEPKECIAYQEGSNINYKGQDYMVVSDLGMQLEICTYYKHGSNEVITIDKSELYELINQIA